jgi:hypothetical protein
MLWSILAIESVSVIPGTIWLLINYKYVNNEVLLTVNEQRNILHEIRKLKANWIGEILRRYT